MNSIMGSDFNEKVTEKWNLWVREQYTVHCSPWKSQHLRLLFMKQYMNSNRIPWNEWKPQKEKDKKKKKKNEENAKRANTEMQRVSKHHLSLSLMPLFYLLLQSAISISIKNFVKFFLSIKFLKKRKNFT